MAEGGQEKAEEAMEKTKERHEKPQNIPDKTKKDSSLQNVSQEKTTFDKNLAAMAAIEQKLKDLTNALYSKVKEDKPYKLTEKKENISSPPTVGQDKAISDQKLSTVQNKAEQIGHNLRDLAQALYSNAKQVLPTELHTVLSEGKDAIAEKLEEEYDEVTRKPKTVHYMAVSQFPKERRIVWALEIGDTYTSFAFSLDATGDVHIGINESRFLSNKTSTIILLDAKGEFISFGCEAEDGYAQIMEEEQQESYYLFKSFPKVLRACMKPGRSIKITDEGGKTLDAKLVFALSIKHFVGMLLRKLENPLLKITMDDVNLVIAIPAIPGDTVSKFVIDAVKEAGINKDQVITVLEPVAASVYGQREESYNSKEECFSLMFGKKYLVVDLGGDSTRITVHIKAERDEVISMTFCPWGGNSVNETFFTILEDAVGTRVLDLLKTTDAESYLDLLRNFETAKRKFSPGLSLIKVTFPLTLATIFKAEHHLSFEEAFSDPRFGKWMSVHQNQLAMTGEQFGKLFRPTLNAIKRYIKDVLKKGENKDISNILMVGGFSRCELVTKEIVEEFKTHKVFIPKEPDLAILKGAVFCGRIPYAMKDNVHKYTFGVQSWPEFDSKIHPIDKKVMIEGTARCRDCFTKFAQKGDHVEVGKKITMLFLALEPEADVLVCELYASDKSEPQFTSECTLQATLSIKLPKTKPENLIIEESFCFGETELQVQARDIYLKPYTVMCSINEMTIRE